MSLRPAQMLESCCQVRSLKQIVWMGLRDSWTFLWGERRFADAKTKQGGAFEINLKGQAHWPKWPFPASQFFASSHPFTEESMWWSSAQPLLWEVPVAEHRGIMIKKPNFSWRRWLKMVSRNSRLHQGWNYIWLSHESFKNSSLSALE